MKYIPKKPIDKTIQGQADDQFYTDHPEMVDVTGQRIPVDPASKAHGKYRDEWWDIYFAKGGEVDAKEMKKKSPKDPKEPCPYVGHIYVTVLDEMTNDKINKGPVQIIGPMAEKKNTNKAGIAKFFTLEKGNYEVIVRVNGYVEHKVNVPVAKGIQHVEAKLKRPMLEIIELNFTNGFSINKWPSGVPIAGPQWKSAANPDLPVCYQKESKNAKLDVKIKLTPQPVGTLKIDIIGEETASALKFEKKSVSLTGTEMAVKDIRVKAGGFPNEVKKTKLRVQWKYTADSGKNWVNMNTTGDHNVYLVFNKPLVSPLYDFGLEKATGYVNGDADIAGKINTGIAADLTYDPSAYRADANPLKYYDYGSCLCMNNAILMEYLCKTLGVKAKVVYVWGGDAANTVVFYHGTSAGIYGSFRVLAPANGMAVLNPHFTYHAQTQTGGATYDPSYGTVSMITLNETAPGGSRRTGSAWPPANRMVVPPASWRCPH